MIRYKRRPGTIEAVQWTGTNYLDIRHEVGTGNITQSGLLYVESDHTWHQLEPGDWIGRDDLGLFLVRGSRFVENYEPHLTMPDPSTGPVWLYSSSPPPLLTLASSEHDEPQPPAVHPADAAGDAGNAEGHPPPGGA